MQLNTLRLALLVLGLLDVLGTGYLALAPTYQVSVPPVAGLLVGLGLMGIQFLTTNLRSWTDAAKTPEQPATETPQVS
jgi:hypothetical protein